MVLKGVNNLNTKLPKIKKTDLAQRLNLRYATLLEWEKNRSIVYERLVLSYEYEKILEQMMGSFDEVKNRLYLLKKSKNSL